MDSKVITEVIAALSERVLTPEHSHMLKPWEMVFGGLVLPLLAELDSAVREDPKYPTLTDRYSREAVEKFFAVREVTKEKVIEKTVEIEKVKVVKVSGGDRAPTLHTTVEAGGKFRRLKDKVAKVSRKRIDIPPLGLDAINTWWNNNQKLADDGDCQVIADAITSNARTITGQPGLHPISAAQVSGWLSWLCRLALKDPADREDYIRKAIRRGKFSVAPEFTAKFINEIANNKEKQAKDRAIAEAAKKRMAAEVASNLSALPTTDAGVQAAQVTA